MQTRPGTRKAPRQDNAAVKAAVTPAAKATPRLPQTALKASARPRLLCVFEKERGTDRMIDGAEDAEREQRRRQHRQRRRQRRCDKRQPAAEIEDDHHVAAAPAVGEPACRQREQTEGGEGGRAERNELGIRKAVDSLKLDDDGRINQDDKVIECVSAVEETEDPPPPRLPA